MPTQVLEFPTQIDRWTLADWVEKTMLLEELEEFARPAIEQRFPANFAVDASDLEELNDEIADRARFAAASYPFRVTAAGVIVLDSKIDRRVYEFLVLLSFRQAQYRVDQRFNEVSPAFDLLVREATRSLHGGETAEAIRFGWPTTDGRPELLADAVRWLGEKLGIPLGSLETLRPSDKDGGVDVVAWKPFASGGPIFPTSLFQNTVAINFQRKPADIALSEWTHLLRFGTEPQVGLAIPFAIEPNSRDWDDLNWRTGVLLDRLRLCQHLSAVDLSSFEPEWAYMADFNARERPALVRNLTSGTPATAGRRRKPTTQP